MTLRHSNKHDMKMDIMRYDSANNSGFLRFYRQIPPRYLMRSCMRLLTCVLNLFLCLTVLYGVEDKVDLVVVTRDSPGYKLELRLGSGWVQCKSINIEKSGENPGWMVREFKPGESVFRKLLNVPIVPGAAVVPPLGYVLESLYYVTVYSNSGSIHHFFVTSESEVKLKGGLILKSDEAINQWLIDTLTIINDAALK